LEAETPREKEGTYMKRAIVLAFALLVAAGTTAAAFARPSGSDSAVAKSPDCRTAGLGFASVFSGPAAPFGADQLHWAQVFLQYWNGNKPVVGLPKGFKRTKIKFRAVGDSALDPQKAATVAGQMLSNKKVLGLVGFVGSNENLGGGPVLDRGGMVYVSSSATRDDVATKLKNFYRVVPNNVAQANIAIGYLFKNNIIKRGQQAMVVDDAEAYGTNQADDMQKLLVAGGVKVDRESITQSTSSATANFSALANKAVATGTNGVFAPTQTATDSQLFAQQLKSAGYKGIFVATDGSFNSKAFNFPGAYLSYFGADVNAVPAAKPYLATFTQRFGETIGFGPPSFTATEMLAMAVSVSCADGKTSRKEVLKTLPKMKIKTSILGNAVAFDNKGDLFHGPKSGVSFFQIQADGSYKLLAKA
jgi:branched-chain amino acid transport system substrate-binding protein